MDEVEIYFKSLFCEQFPIVGEFLTYLKETKNYNEVEVGKDYELILTNY